MFDEDGGIIAFWLIVRGKMESASWNWLCFDKVGGVIAAPNCHAQNHYKTSSQCCTRLSHVERSKGLNGWRQIQCWNQGKQPYNGYVVEVKV